METKIISGSQDSINNTQDNAIAITAYLTIIGLIIALLKNNQLKEAFTSFHIRQMLGICCTGLAVGILGMLPFVGLLIYFVGMLFVIVLWTIGLIGAISRQEKKVFLLGGLYQTWFKGVS